MRPEPLGNFRSYLCYTPARKLFEEALASRKWIYDPARKTWYSPAEFHNCFGKILKETKGDISNLELRDPNEAMSEVRKKINSLQARLDQFIEMIVGKSTENF